MDQRPTPLNLTKKVTRRLGALAGGENEAIEAAIALWPLGSRMTLASHGIVDTHRDNDDAVWKTAAGGETTCFSLTEQGRKILEECARWRAWDDARQELELVEQQKHEAIERLQRLDEDRQEVEGQLNDLSRREDQAHRVLECA
jgi:hypothetical protein